MLDSEAISGLPSVVQQRSRSINSQKCKSEVGRLSRRDTVPEQSIIIVPESTSD